MFSEFELFFKMCCDCSSENIFFFLGRFLCTKWFEPFVLHWILLPDDNMRCMFNQASGNINLKLDTHCKMFVSVSNHTFTVQLTALK